jgi:hypothetical protein
VLCHDLQRLHQGVEGKERLARAHRYQIRSARNLLSDTVSVVKRDDDLLDNLARRERP